MTVLVGIAGSLRRRSLNAALLRSAATLLPDGVTLDIASLAPVPLYNGDLEADQGIPAGVADLKERVARADGLVVATPEYNNAMPGVLKNAVDWLSRPAQDIKRVYGGKPLALMGASPGRLGTALAQASWLPVWRTLGVRLYSGGGFLYVPTATAAFDDDGELIDEKLRERLGAYLRGFVDFVRAAGTA